jgi:hypothetical protein
LRIVTANVPMALVRPGSAPGAGELTQTLLPIWAPMFWPATLVAS